MNSHGRFFKSTTEYHSLTFPIGGVSLLRLHNFLEEGVLCADKDISQAD